MGLPVLRENDESFDVVLPPNVLVTDGDSSQNRTPVKIFDDGPYGAVCTDVQKQTAKSGIDMYVFTFMGVQGAAEGLTFYDRCSLSPNALFRLSNTLKAFGVVGETDQATGDVKISFKRKDIIGKQATLLLKKETFNERDRMAVARVLPPTATAVAVTGPRF